MTVPSYRFQVDDAAARALVSPSIQCEMVGAVAQLGERLNGIQEVVGSIPISSTNLNIPFHNEIRG